MKLVNLDSKQKCNDNKVIYDLEDVDIGSDEDTCPICNFKITPEKIGLLKIYNDIYILSKCPSKSCGKPFISQYKLNYSFDGEDELWDYDLIKSYPKHYVKKEFDKIINKISPNFALIYNQANEAEQLELTEICGVGYRKALEFLIKDYCIKNKPNLKGKIENINLGEVINKDISNENIKECAKRAVWLGNDETHYVRRWENKDINDLKILIKLTINWILTEETTKQYLESMPK